MLQSCPTLCDPMDRSLPGSSIPGIFQATVLECGAIAFSYDLRRWSPTFLAPRRPFSHSPGGREMVSGGLRCITFIVTLFLLLLHQLHLRSPGIRTKRVETPVLRYIPKFIFLVYEYPIISALFVEK